MEMKIIEMEMVEELQQEKPWKIVNNNKKNKKKKNQLMRRPWDALPSVALSNIIRNLNFPDRFGSFPLVCKAWNSVISNDPRCWSSMIPESVSPDDAFLNKCQVELPSKLLYRPDRPVPIGGKSDDPSICPVVSYFRSFIKKSSCSSGFSTVTSLCLDPFSFFYPYESVGFPDQILHLIAHCCPNLKHISFNGFYWASIEAVLEVFHSCTKIELIDFSSTRYAESVQVIEELVNCLPNLRGIRMQRHPNYFNRDIIGYISTHFPWIKLHFEVPEYIECEFCDTAFLDRESIYRVTVNRYRLHSCHTLLCYHCWQELEEEEAVEKACLESLYGEEEEYSILKQKKERRRYHQYVRVVLRTGRMRKKNKKHQEVSFILKMKMRKKRDTYDYQDFYVRAAAF